MVFYKCLPSDCAKVWTTSCVCCWRTRVTTSCPATRQKRAALVAGRCPKVLTYRCLPSIRLTSSWTETRSSHSSSPPATTAFTGDCCISESFIIYRGTFLLRSPLELGKSNLISQVIDSFSRNNCVVNKFGTFPVVTLIAKWLYYGCARWLK